VTRGSDLGLTTLCPPVNLAVRRGGSAMEESVSARPSTRRRWVRAGASLAAALTIAGSAAVVSVSQATASASTVRASALQGVQLTLTIPGITDVGATKGQGSISISSWSWGVSNTSSGNAGGTKGRTTLHQIVITKTQDKSSPLLYQACVSGAHYKTVTLAMRSAPTGGSTGQPDSAVIVLSNVMIANVQTGGAGGGDPVESVSLNFTKITYDYTTGADGSVAHMGWNLATNKKV
jgi:type VI secretion system Hcp family effector